MARPALPEMSPWKRQPLTVPPESWRDWMRLAVWELWMGLLLGGALMFGVRLITAAPDNMVTVFDFTNCYAVPPVGRPCERIAYRGGTLNVAFNVWFGVLLIAFAAWLMWELWNAVAPKPITDEFLKLLDNTFGRSWRSLRTWPWARMGWAYGFTLIGAASALGLALLVSMLASSARPAPAPHVETSQHFRM